MPRIHLSWLLLATAAALRPQVTRRSLYKAAPALVLAPQLSRAADGPTEALLPEAHLPPAGPHGMIDAFAECLGDAPSSAPPAGVPKDAVETVVDALPTSGPHAIVAEIGEGYAYDDLGAAITQRSVQTQLQYSAALRNEPQVSWLSKFLGHDHLGPKLRDTGSAGPPSSYTPALCQLRGNWVEY